MKSKSNAKSLDAMAKCTEQEIIDYLNNVTEKFISIILTLAPLIKDENAKTFFNELLKKSMKISYLTINIAAQSIDVDVAEMAEAYIIDFKGIFESFKSFCDLNGIKNGI